MNIYIIEYNATNEEYDDYSGILDEAYLNEIECRKEVERLNSLSPKAHALNTVEIHYGVKELELIGYESM